MKSRSLTLAIFDVDHTIIKGDSLLWFSQFLLRRRRPALAEIPRFVALTLGYLAHITDAGELKAALLKVLAYGMGSAEMTSIIDEFTEKVLLPGLYPQAQDRMRWHQRQGHHLVFLSASPATYLERLAESLDVEAVIATRLKWHDGVFLGEIDGRNCKGQEKLVRLLRVYDGQDVEWQDSYYYADSAADIPVFEKVGRPVIVNPKPRMVRIGTQRRWPVENWR